MEKHFFTQDFYLAATAMAKKFELMDYYREGNFTTFVFRQSPEMTQLVKDYYAESLMIEPLRHARSIKALKSMIHALSLSTAKSPSANEFPKKRQRQ